MAYTQRKDSYTCKTCGEVFPNPWLLGSHNRHKHPKKKKLGRPRKTIVRVGNKKKVVDKDANWEFEVGMSPRPRQSAYAVNFCPNCSCPLHGAREGLTTELELRRGQ